MSQISDLYDGSTEALLVADEDVKNLMATLNEPASVNMNFPSEIQPSFDLPYEELLLQHTQSGIVQDMPQADHIPTSGTNNNLAPVNKQEFAGEYNFEVFIDPHHGTKSPWVYSQALKKVFIQMNSLFPVDVKVTRLHGVMMPQLFVRVTPSYNHSQDSLTLVSRCLQHIQADQNHDISQNIWEHIIRCNNHNATYHGGQLSNNQEHLSVLLPLNQPANGLDAVRQMYQFVCKNSCTSGMNRRQLDVVFTLEDNHANVFGRILMSARICSCPKRDKEKEEKEYFNRGTHAPPPKKRKAEKRSLSMIQSTSDITEYDLSIKIPGKHNLQAVYKYIYDLMAGEMNRHGAEGPFRKTMNDINKLTKNAD